MIKSVFILVLVCSGPLMARDERLYYSVDTWSLKRNAVSVLEEATPSYWYYGLSEAEIHEVVDSLVVAVRRFVPFQEGEFEAWREDLYDIRLRYRKNGKLIYGARYQSATDESVPGMYGIYIEPPHRGGTPEVAALTVHSDSASAADSALKCGFNVIVKELEAGIYEARFEEEDSLFFQCDEALGPLRNLAVATGVILNFSDWLHEPQAVIKRIASQFLPTGGPSLIEDTIDKARNQLTTKQDTIPPNPKAYRGPLVVVLGYGEVAYLVGDLLECRPQTKVLVNRRPNYFYSTAPRISYGDPILLPYGRVAHVPSTIFRKPCSHELSRAPTGMLSIAEIPLTGWDKRARERFADYKARPLEELKRLMKVNRTP